MKWSDLSPSKQRFLRRTIKQGYDGKYAHLVPGYNSGGSSGSDRQRSGGGSPAPSTGNNEHSYKEDKKEEKSQTGNNDYNYTSGSGGSLDFNKLVNIGVAFMVLNLVISIFKR